MEPSERSAVEFRDWHFEPRQILGVLRGDVRYLSQCNMGSDTAKPPRDVLLRTDAKPYRLVLDPGKLGDECNDCHYDTGFLAKVHFGTLVIYFIKNERKENAEELFLLDYTVSFGSCDRPGPILRFLRIINVVAPMSTVLREFKSQAIETTQWNPRGPLGPAVPQMMVLSIDERMRFRPYLEVRGTAIPIYSSIKDLNNLLDGVHEESKAFLPKQTAIEKLNHALDLMTANGWSEHIKASNRATSKQGEKSLGVSQRKPPEEDTGGVSHGKQRTSVRSPPSGQEKVAPELSDVE